MVDPSPGGGQEIFPFMLGLMHLAVTKPECRRKEVARVKQTIKSDNSIRIVSGMLEKLKPVAMHATSLANAGLEYTDRVGVYLVSGRVLSSSDGPSRLSASGDWETQQQKKSKQH